MGLKDQIFDFVLVKLKKTNSPTKRGWDPYLAKPLYCGLSGWPIKIWYVDGILFPLT